MCQTSVQTLSTLLDLPQFWIASKQFFFFFCEIRIFFYKNQFQAIQGLHLWKKLFGKNYFALFKNIYWMTITYIYVCVCVCVCACVCVRIQYQGQIDQFKNYSYSTGPRTKKCLQITTQRCQYERDSLTTWHKINLGMLN